MCCGKNKYFSKAEFQCPCCMVSDMDVNFIQRLLKARMIAGTPFNINSGFRCNDHNKSVGGSVDSAHTKGMACDIAVINDRDRYLILESLFRAGFKRIGVYPSWIHVDSDESKDQKVSWVKL